ncbi:MAG: MBL fold metallo-hydrolase [Mizugakiibacter sp.]|uniref:MBL fold metallo-hydrolase n=1 Tax=Mizugakiibacter sp. TaxID=1972610 RepID=UPI0031C6BABA|nr:MBL fold metallo-hydrolase [Xanthomonadaceae bacterium]
MSPRIVPFFHADSGTWSYLVADPAGHAAVVDPVLDYDAAAGRVSTRAADAIVERVRTDGLDVQWILETHAHADHLSAAQYLKARVGGQVCIGAGIRRVQSTFAEVFNLGGDFATDGSQFDRLFDDGERFAIGALQAQVIACPGHTNDSVCYRIDDALFVGDTLFAPDVGTARCDFPGGDAALLYRTIRRLYELPDATRVFLCHDYPPQGRAPQCETSIGAEKAANIHVTAATGEDEFVARRRARDATLAAPRLLYPAVQVNIRAGALPAAEANGRRYLRIPLRGGD